MIRPDDLSDEQREIADIIGIDNYLKLSAAMGGTMLYIAKAEEIAARKRRDERIREEFDGTNTTELARKYGLTEVWIRKIAADKYEEIKRTPIPGQMNLSDFLGSG